MEKMIVGNVDSKDIDQLLNVTKQIEGHTICAFGEGASWPVQGLLRHFRKEIEKRNNLTYNVLNSKGIPYFYHEKSLFLRF